MRRKKRMNEESAQNELLMRQEARTEDPTDESEGSGAVLDLSYVEVVYSCDSSLTKPQIQECLEKQGLVLNEGRVFELGKMHVFDFLQAWKSAWTSRSAAIERGGVWFVLYDLEARHEELLWAILTPILTESGECFLTDESARSAFKSRWKNFAVVVPGLAKREVVIPPVEALISASSIPKIKLKVTDLKYDWKRKPFRSSFSN